MEKLKETKKNETDKMFNILFASLPPKSDGTFPSCKVKCKFNYDPRLDFKHLSAIITESLIHSNILIAYIHPDVVLQMQRRFNDECRDRSNYHSVNMEVSLFQVPVDPDDWKEEGLDETLTSIFPGPDYGAQDKKKLKKDVTALLQRHSQVSVNSFLLAQYQLIRHDINTNLNLKKHRWEYVIKNNAPLFESDLKSQFLKALPASVNSTSRMT